MTRDVFSIASLSLEPGSRRDGAQAGSGGAASHTTGASHTIGAPQAAGASQAPGAPQGMGARGGLGGTGAPNLLDASDAPAALPSPTRDEPEPGGARVGIREKASPQQVEEMRKWIETTDLPLKRIGAALGVSPATLSRYARQEGWVRPEQRAERGKRRERVTEKLWRLAERHAEALEDQPIELAQRSLTPLVRLTRTLGDIDKHAAHRVPIDLRTLDTDAPPKRNLHDLRAELQQHLERIEREEKEYDERWIWSFEKGAGI